MDTVKYSWVLGIIWGEAERRALKLSPEYDLFPLQGLLLHFGCVTRVMVTLWCCFWKKEAWWQCVKSILKSLRRLWILISAAPMSLIKLFCSQRGSVKHFLSWIWRVRSCRSPCLQINLISGTWKPCSPTPSACLHIYLGCRVFVTWVTRIFRTSESFYSYFILLCVRTLEDPGRLTHYLKLGTVGF